jgi:putative ABC transport system permease protein
MRDFVRELGHAWRRVRRAPAFTATTLIVLALGLGTTTAMFSMVYAILLRSLPYPASDRLVSVSHTIAVSGVSHVEQSDASFLLYQRHNTVFASIGGYRDAEVNLGAVVGKTGDTELVPATGVSASLLPTLGVSPARGRAFSADDDRPGAPPVIILSDRLWRGRFGADPSIVSKKILINDEPREVIGVMAPGFRFPSATPQLWYPMRLDPAKADPGSFNYSAVARLKPGVTATAAAADLDRILPGLLDEFPSNIPKAMFEQAHVHPVVQPLRDVVVGGVTRLLWILFGAVGLVLVIACANVANLFLVRSEGRQRELAVRTALGAGGAALVAQHLGEAMVLATGGGALGIALAATAVRLLSALPAGIDVPRLTEVSVGPAVGLFALVATIASAVAVCLVPLLRTQRIAISSVLKESGRSATSGRERHRTRGLLVIAQLALALILVAASGLMARSFARLRDVKAGFSDQGVATLGVSLPRARYTSTAALVNFYDNLMRKTRGAAGVEDAALTSWIPLTGDNDNGVVSVEDQALKPNAVPPVHDQVYAMSSFFSTMRIPLLAGRVYENGDATRAALEAVVSRGFAERYWSHGSPLGKRIRPGIDGPWFTIVGVVGDIHLHALEKPAEQAVYFPLIAPKKDGPDVPSRVAIVARGATAPSTLLTSVRNVVHSIDAAVPTYAERPMTAIVGAASAQARFLVLLLAAASGIALVLGAVGIYGVMAYGVSLREREIGVRMALGARPSDVTRMISGQGLALAAIGVAIGLGASLGVTRLLRGLLYDISPADPLTLLGSAAVLLGVALLASWLPARRAASIDPGSVLRGD